MTDLQVANTILEQLGGRKFLVMTGAKNLIGNNVALTMRVNGRCKAGAVNFVRITLDPTDTYTVEGYYIRGHKMSPRCRATDVYCDRLQEMFTEATGLYTSLGTIRG